MALGVRTVSKERKEHIQNLMKLAPMTFPYADLAELRKTTPLIDRYNSSMDILSEEDLESIGKEKDHLPELLLCRWQAGKYVAEQLKSRGIPYSEAASFCQIDKSLFTKYSNGERPLGLEAEALVPLCINLLNESCNKVMFGEDGKIIIPGVYGTAVKCFLKLSEDQQRNIVNMGNELRKTFEMTNPTVAGVGLHRDPDDLIRDRLWQLAYASGRNVENFFGEKQERRIRNNIKAYFENNELYRPRMSFTAFLAFETGYALDYFIVEDFTGLTPCYIQDGDDLVEIKDKLALRFIGNIFAVDKATSTKMSAPVFSDFLTQN